MSSERLVGSHMKNITLRTTLRVAVEDNSSSLQVFSTEAPKSDGEDGALVSRSVILFIFYLLQYKNSVDETGSSTLFLY